MINSLQTICNQVIIIDGGSTDKTVEYALDYDCEVYTGNNSEYCEGARAKGITYAKNDYILILDADERLTPYFIGEVSSIMSAGVQGAYLWEQLIIDDIPRYTESRYRFALKDHIKLADQLHAKPEPVNLERVWHAKDVCITHKKTWSEVIASEERYDKLADKWGKPELKVVNFHLNKLKELGTDIYDILEDKI